MGSSGCIEETLERNIGGSSVYILGRWESIEASSENSCSQMEKSDCIAASSENSCSCCRKATSASNLAKSSFYRSMKDWLASSSDLLASSFHLLQLDSSKDLLVNMWVK